MKLMKKMGISAVTIMMMFAISACGDDMAGTDPAQPTGEAITEAEAKAIVLDKVPGATEADIYEFEKEYDDGRIEYEGSLYYDGYEYEFDVDGTSGNMLKWEIDRETF